VSITQRLGEQKEDLAARFLRRHGLTLEQRNVRCRFGEIDLVLRDREVLVFAEVRFRADDGHGGGAASVDARKRARLIAAARWYLAGHPREAERPCRFDVLALGAGEEIEWIRDAFRIDS
jgi:putative endonuclease